MTSNKKDQVAAPISPRASAFNDIKNLELANTSVMSSLGKPKQS